MKKVIILLITVLIIGMLTGCDKGTKTFIYDPGEPFVTDVFKSSKLLKAEITIEVNDEAVFKKFEENTGKVRDIIVFILRSKTEEELKGLGPIEIKKEIMEKLKEEFQNNNIVEVSFSDFVVQ